MSFEDLGAYGELVADRHHMVDPVGLDVQMLRGGGVGRTVAGQASRGGGREIPRMPAVTWRCAKRLWAMNLSCREWPPGGSHGRVFPGVPEQGELPASLDCGQCRLRPIRVVDCLRPEDHNVAVDFSHLIGFVTDEMLLEECVGGGTSTACSLKPSDSEDEPFDGVC